MARKAYFIQETVKDDEGNYIPCIAVEGESGFYKTDWEWGPDKAEAEKIAEDMNAKLGLTPKDAMLIQLSTMSF